MAKGHSGILVTTCMTSAVACLCVWYFMFNAVWLPNEAKAVLFGIAHASWAGSTYALARRGEQKRWILLGTMIVLLPFLGIVALAVNCLILGACI